LRSAAASTVPSGEFCLQRVDDVGGDLAVAVDLDDFVEQLLRQDFFAAQVNQAFDDQGQGDDRGNQQQPDGPACSLKNGEQNELLKKG
jgi:hypothetical protein